jgi:MscS family membrane protein
MKTSICFCAFLACSILLSTAQAQDLANEIQKATGTQRADQANAQEEKSADSKGRDTPQGTVLGFLQAAQSGKYKEASQYLQLSKHDRATEGEEKARQLHDLMDKAFVGRVGAISHAPEGSEQTGIPKDHEQIGVFRINGNETGVDLARVSEPTGGAIWLFSTKTLNDLQNLSNQIEDSAIEAELPRVLVNARIFNTPIWRLIIFLGLVPVSFGLAWTIVRLIRSGFRLLRRWRHLPVIEDISASAPATLILTVLIHGTGIYLLGIPLLILVYYQRICMILLIAGFGWLVFPIITRWGDRARLRAIHKSEGSSGAIILLGQRALKAIVVLVCLLAILSTIGFDMTTAIAALGIGSVAVAFAAQKTLENLLGGVSIVADQVISVGEFCRINENEGTVIDISLRSTRIRTLQGTILSVPNGQLANMDLENISRRNMSLFQTTLELRHDTSADKLRILTSEIRTLLRDHPKVNSEFVRVHVAQFEKSSIEVTVNCRIETKALDEFLAIREGLLLQITDLLSRSGIQWAAPPQVLYIPEQRTSEQRTIPIKRNAS